MSLLVCCFSHPLADSLVIPEATCSIIFFTSEHVTTCTSSGVCTSSTCRQLCGYFILEIGWTVVSMVFSSSIISFQDAFVDYVIPKTYFNDTDKSYYASITTCVHLAHNSNPGSYLTPSFFPSIYMKGISGVHNAL